MFKRGKTRASVRSAPFLHGVRSAFDITGTTGLAGSRSVPVGDPGRTSARGDKGGDEAVIWEALAADMRRLA